MPYLSPPVNNHPAMHHFVSHQSLPSHPYWRTGWCGRDRQDVRNIKVRCNRLFVSLQSQKCYAFGWHFGVF